MDTGRKPVIIDGSIVHRMAELCHAHPGHELTQAQLIKWAYYPEYDHNGKPIPPSADITNAGLPVCNIQLRRLEADGLAVGRYNGYRRYWHAGPTQLDDCHIRRPPAGTRTLPRHGTALDFSFAPPTPVPADDYDGI